MTSNSSRSGSAASGSIDRDLIREKDASIISHGLGDDQFHIEFYHKSLLRQTLCIFLYIITGGLFFLILRWMPHHWAWFNLNKSDDYTGDIVSITDQSATIYQKLNTVQGKILAQFARHLLKSDPCDKTYITLEYKKNVYIVYHGELVLLTGIEQMPNNEILKMARLSPGAIDQVRELFGFNEITVTVPSIGAILFTEILNPFYCFQIFSVVLWFVDEYIMYAVSIVVMTAGSMITTLYQVRKERRHLRDMVEKNNTSKVTCFRNTEWVELLSRELVPGDIISIPPGGCILPADCVLLTGECIVDEGMLTGESIPVVKLPLKSSNDLYHPESISSRAFTLYGGTVILQTRSGGAQGVQCTGLVVRTSYQTARGRLVQSILHPKPIDSRLNNDAVSFVLLMGVIALIGFSYSVVMQYYGCVKTSEIVLKSLDVLTIVVPPALPAALAVGITYAQKRLKKKNIFTISPKRINLSGSVNLALFDKTGTLTEDGLEFHGVVEDINRPIEVDTTNVSVELRHSLAACHSLTRINGVLSGDPLELEMMSSTGWQLIEPIEGEGDNLEFAHVADPSGHDQTKIYHIRQFAFSSETARQTVLCRKVTQEMSSLVTLIKGAPERIAIMVGDENLPPGYFERLDELTRQGHRVIALAEATPTKIKAHRINKAKREDLELEPRFLGFLILQNKLKPQTAPVLSELNRAGIQSVMVTGDNILTAICVAREAGLLRREKKILVASIRKGLLIWSENNTTMEHDEICLDEDFTFQLAMTGDTFKWIKMNRPQLMKFILVRGAVFARMDPDDKAQLVDAYEKLDFVCSFCGDGANDCAALKRASVGISLSELEASVASPFTSKVADISCVTKLIKEGRCALMTTFGMFKYMALYSMIQFCTILILYFRVTNISDWEYLYIDLIIINLVALTMSLNEPSDRISRHTPPRVLMAAPTVFSLVGHLVVCIGFQVIVYLFLLQHEWFCSMSDQSPPCLDSSGYVLAKPNNGSYPVTPDRFDYERCNEMNVHGAKHVDEEGDVIVATHTSAALFYFSSFQYIITAFVFSVGEPFRRPVNRNLLFLTSLIALTAMTCFIVVSDNEWIAEQFEVVWHTEHGEMIKIPSRHESNFRYYIICFAVFNFFVSFAIEHYIVENRRFWSFWKRFQTLRHKNKQYLVIEDQINSNAYWPPRESFLQSEA